MEEEYVSHCCGAEPEAHFLEGTYQGESITCRACGKGCDLIGEKEYKIKSFVRNLNDLFDKKLYYLELLKKEASSENPSKNNMADWSIQIGEIENIVENAMELAEETTEYVTNMNLKISTSEEIETLYKKISKYSEKMKLIINKGENYENCENT